MKKRTFIFGIVLLLIMGSAIMMLPNERGKERMNVGVAENVDIVKVELDPVEEVKDFQDFKSKINLQLEEYQ